MRAVPGRAGRAQARFTRASACSTKSTIFEGPLRGSNTSWKRMGDAASHPSLAPRKYDRDAIPPHAVQRAGLHHDGYQNDSAQGLGNSTFGKV